MMTSVLFFLIEFCFGGLGSLAEVTARFAAGDGCYCREILETRAAMSSLVTLSVK